MEVTLWKLHKVFENMMVENSMYPMNCKPERNTKCIRFGFHYLVKSKFPYDPVLLTSIVSVSLLFLFSAKFELSHQLSWTRLGRNASDEILAKLLT